jgi:hypothetical protein
LLFSWVSISSFAKKFNPPPATVFWFKKVLFAGQPRQLEIFIHLLRRGAKRFRTTSLRYRAPPLNFPCTGAFPLPIRFDKISAAKCHIQTKSMEGAGARAPLKMGNPGSLTSDSSGGKEM